jgi:plasmid stabilization system protein ParE
VIVRWSQAAATQLFEAGDYLAGQRPGWDARLYTATRKITAPIAQQPRAFTRVDEVRDGEVRKALVPLYQYWVIYEVFEGRGECIVLAFWFTRRHPRGWRHPR